MITHKKLNKDRKGKEKLERKNIDYYIGRNRLLVLGWLSVYEKIKTKSLN